jgi:hypothetical protein
MKKETRTTIAIALSKIIEEYSNKADINDCIVGIVLATIQYLSFIKKTIDDDEDVIERKFLDYLKDGDDVLNLNFNEYITNDGNTQMRESVRLDTVVRLMGMIRRGLINPSTKNIEIMRILNQTNKKAS